jgi:integrase
MARLTKRAIEAIRPGEHDQFLWDDELRGFGVRVYPSGARKYLLQWKRDGHTRRLVLGTHGLITCEEARNEARTKLGAIAKGHDPADERDARKRDLTLAALLDLYMAEGAGHLKPGSREVYRSAFERHVTPLLGNRKLSGLRSADVAKLQEDVANGRTAGRKEGEARKGGRVVVRGGRGIAARVRQYLGAALSWAVRRGLLEQNPAAGVAKFKTRTLERFLNAEEFRRLGTALAEAEAEGANPRFVAAVRLLALTGCRKNEIAHLRWSDVDLGAAVLRLSDTKSGAKTLPLSPEAVVLLAGLPQEQNSPWVFPATRGDGPIMGLPKFFAGLCRHAGLQAVTLHTLRHSLASTAAASGASLYLVGKALGHANITTTQRYAHVQIDPVAQVMAVASGRIAQAMNAGARNAVSDSSAAIVELTTGRSATLTK